METIELYQVQNSDRALIHQLAQWYRDEWNSTIEDVANRLENQSSDDLLCHLVLLHNDHPVSAGGVYFNVNLHKVHPQYKTTGPWVGMMYTLQEFRRRGYAEYVLLELEKRAREEGFTELYLYTATAESLYTKCGWQSFDEVVYKGHSTVIMKKILI